MKIEVGQVYRDKDGRGNSRKIRVVAKANARHWWIENTETHRRSRISTTRLADTGARGWERVKAGMTAHEAGVEMLEAMGDPDWGFENGGGRVQGTVSAEQFLRWCEALNYDPPEGTIEHAKKARGSVRGG